MWRVPVSCSLLCVWARPSSPQHGSIRPGSIEMMCKYLLTLQTMAKANCMPSPHCGLHVHVCTSMYTIMYMYEGWQSPVLTVVSMLEMKSSAPNSKFPPFKTVCWASWASQTKTRPTWRKGQSNMVLAWDLADSLDRYFFSIFFILWYVMSSLYKSCSACTYSSSIVFYFYGVLLEFLKP